MYVGPLVDESDRQHESGDTVIGERISVVGKDRWRIGQELSIAPQTNSKRRGAYAAFGPGKTVGTLQLGVFATPNDALRIFREHLEFASIPPKEVTTGRLGQRSAGWWNEEYRGFDRIVFVRDNAVVDLRLMLDQTGQIRDPNNVTVACAKRIDAALAFGRYGVLRANEIRLPRIVSVQMPVVAGPGMQVQAEVRIVSPEAERGGGYSAKNEVQITQTIPFLVPAVDPNDDSKAERTIPYEVVYITTGCAIASQEATLKVNPAMAAKPKMTPEQEKRLKELMEKARRGRVVPRNK